jgi:hypothetical protein
MGSASPALCGAGMTIRIPFSRVTTIIITKQPVRTGITQIRQEYPDLDLQC